MTAYQIAYLRKERGWTQAELAKLVGTSQQQIARWESGAADLKVGTALKLAEAFDVSLARLLAIDDETREATDPLEDAELKLLQLYRAMSPTGQAALVAAADGIARAFPVHRED